MTDRPTGKKRLGKSENQKAALSQPPDAPARRLKRAVAWHKRVQDQERATSRKADSATCRKARKIRGLNVPHFMLQISRMKII